jgi:hypothetical protein
LVVQVRVLKFPGAFLLYGPQKYPFRSLKSRQWDKAYIPEPREHEYVAKNHNERETTEKEVINTSNKEKKVVAPASKTTPAAAKTNAKKSHGKRG